MRHAEIISLVPVSSSTNAQRKPVYVDGVPRQVFAEKKSIRQSEFYQAAAAGLRPELTLIVWSREYGGEQWVDYNGKRYSVIRTFDRDDERTELVCQGIVNRS